MTKTPYARKAIAVLLSVTMLLSCMVWTGVSAATVDSLDGRQLAVLDFTSMPKESSGNDAYPAAGGGNNAVVSGKVSSLATIDANGGSISLKYLTNNSDKYAAFRFFPTQRISDTTNYTSNGNDDFRFKSGVTYSVTFKYKVVSAPVAAELRFFNVGQSWASNYNASGSVGHTDYLNMQLAAGVTHTDWQTHTFTVTAGDTNGIHFAVVPNDMANANGLEVQMTDIVISLPSGRVQGTEYTTNFTGYGVTANTDMSATTSTKAQVVATGEATHGDAMQLSFLNGTGMKQAGFRFFANTGTVASTDRVAFAQGTTALVKLSYKVQNLASAAELRVIAGSWPWTGGPNNETGTYNTPSEHCAVAATLPATSTAGEWQTATVLVKGACGNAGIHIYLDSANPTAGDAILVDDVKVLVGYTPITVTLDYGYDSKTETLQGLDDAPVAFPAITRNGYILKGWYTRANGQGTKVTDLVFSDDIHGVTYYAAWEVDPNAAIIKFNTNGGDALSDLYGDKGTAATLPTPTKGAYTFDGWYVDDALTEKAENVKFPATAGDSITLYAKWSDPAPLAATTAPVGKLLGKQTFEVDAIEDIDLQKFNSIDAGCSYEGSKSLKTTVVGGFNSQRGRPRIVIKADGGSNIKVEAGKTYAVSFWVRSELTDSTFTFYAATMGASDVDTMINAISGDCHKLQNITATVGNATASLNGDKNEAKDCTLYADQWTQVVITIPSLVADDPNDDNYLSIGCSYGSAGSAFNCDMYIDNIELYECRTVTVSFDTDGGDALDPVTSETGTVNLPEPYKFGYTYTGWYEDAELTKPVTSPYSPEADTQTLYTTWKKSAPQQVTLVQDFEDATSIGDFTTNTTKPFDLATDKSAGTGTKALKSTIKAGFNGNFARPIWAFQMKGQTAPLQVVPGTAATVTFKVMTTRDTNTLGYMLDTVNDLANITKNSPTSGAANEFRTMQVLSSTSVGTLNGDKNEVQKISMTAGQWVTVTAEIPSIKAHGGGAQYLVLAITDTASSSTSYTNMDMYVDDISITTYVGGHSTQVTYNTMGGDAMESGTGIVWMDIAVEATRDGYTFDGWYTDEDCTTAITAYPCEKEVTLYAGWRPVGAEVMTFEVRDDYVPTVYAHTDLEQAKVQEYYTGNANNWYTGAPATHSLADVGGVKAMKVVYGGGADGSSMMYGFRLVNKDGSAFKTTVGQTYSVSFKYKVEALPKDTYATVIEGSIPWSTGTPNTNSGYREFDGTLISTADVGGDWKQATVNFVSENENGIHLSLRSTAMGEREGTIIYFSDIKVQSYQLSKFTTSNGAARVTGEQNYTADGNNAIKVDTATTGRVVYASGLGEKTFPTNTINTATAWLYAEQDTDVILKAYNDPDLTKLDENAYDMGEKAVSLKGDKWTRVQMEFGLTAVTGEAATYVSLGVSSASGATVYMDDVSLGTYPNDSTKTQGYEEFAAKTYENTSRLDGTIHGLGGTTVVSGKGHNSQQSLQITMNTEEEQNVSRTVLMLDKMDATGTVGSSYIFTFYAMAEEDMDVTFAVGTTGKIDVSDRDMYATTAEAGASKTVSLEAGQWTPISVEVSDLQGKNPEMTVNPYLTLAAWFAGAAEDNAKAVYIDDVTMKDYIAPSVTREDILCFENADVFGFGKNINLSSTGKMEVVLDQNHTEGGYYSVKVTNSSISGGDRPQFNLMNANGEAIKVEKGKTYRVTYWIYVDEVKSTDKVRWWLTVTDSTDPYTTTDQKKAEVVYESDGTAVTKGAWTQVAVTLEDVARSGYLRLGISGHTAGVETVFYLDDLRATEYKVFELTGTETVWDFETYNPDDKDFIRKGTGGVSDEVNHTDKGLNSMKLVGKSWSGADRNQFILINPATKQPYEFVKGDSYTVTYWMYYSSATGLADFQMNAWILGVDDVNEVIDGSEKSDMNGKFEWDGALDPITNDGTLVPDAWNQFEVTFTATNGKYMLVGMTNSAIMTGGYSYFLDDIEIRKPTPAVVTFDANGGAFDETDEAFLNDKGQYVERTAVGLYATGPSIDPYLSGKRFMGWATDPEGQNHFDLLTATIDKTELTLYAMWGDWDEEEGYDKIDKGNLTDNKDEVKYRTEIHQEKVWTGNATIPVLDFDDDFALDDADPVTYIPNQNADPDPVADGLPAWLIIVIIVAAVVVVGGGAVLALLLLKNKKSNDEKEGNA